MGIWYDPIDSDMGTVRKGGVRKIDRALGQGKIVKH